MKNLGKKLVSFETFLDGNLQRSWNENRNVYQNKKGKFFINSSSSKQEVQLVSENQYFCKMESATIHNVMNGAQFLEHISNHFLNKINK